MKKMLIITILFFLTNSVLNAQNKTTSSYHYYQIIKDYNKGIKLLFNKLNVYRSDLHAMKKELNQTASKNFSNSLSALL
jgi:hypothetical protein